MVSKSVLPYSTLVVLALTQSGCLHLPPYRIKRKKIIIPQTEYTVHNAPITHADRHPTVTIWIHGTRLIPNPVFHAYVYSPPGLNPVTVLDSSYHLRQVADAIVHADPINYPLDHFYIFGWSGKLSAEERTSAAQFLYQELVRLKTIYQEMHGITPRLRIITHSHGGNIALQLARLQQPEDHMTIDELILLACPVQKNTMDHVHDPLFKQVYSLYSSLDIFQVLAPQFCYRVQRKKGNKQYWQLKMPLFSSRKFEPHEKLAQIKVKVNGRAISHTKFTSTSFTRTLPTVVKEIAAWQTELPQYPHDTHDTRRLVSIYA